MILQSQLEDIYGKYSDPQILKQKWEKDQSVGSGYYYSITYEPITYFFNQHKDIADHLELKIALVFSWNPKICEVSKTRFCEGRKKFVELRNIQDSITDKTIKEIDIPQYLPPFWNAIKLVTSKTNTAGVSVTKFLHFSFPKIFPMIDINTMKKLGKNVYDENSYKELLLAWKCLFIKHESSFKILSSSLEMPYARILDIMLFNPK